MKLSIRLKFLLVMSGLLLTCLGTYLLMAITVFKSDKTDLVFDLNKSQVSNLANELDASLSGVSEKLKLFTQLPNNLREKMVGELFTEESDLIALRLYKNIQAEPFVSYSNHSYLNTYGVDEKKFSREMSYSSIPFEKILKQGDSIWNASVEGFPPMMGYARLVLQVDQNSQPLERWVVVGFIKLDRLLKSVNVVKLSDTVIANADGEVLVQREAERLFSHPSLGGDPFFQKAIEMSTRTSVTKIEQGQDQWLAAIAKAFGGKLIIITKAPEKQAFAAVKRLTLRTLLFGSIVLTMIILAAFLLSRTLTHNIALLVERMIAVSQGDLSTPIRLQGQDETVTLGDSFNQMIFDLKKSRDELEVMNRELDNKVKERTRELEEQKIKVVEAQEAMIKTARLASMGEIAGRAAHEVLNPLTSLLTRAGFVQKKVDAQYRESIELLSEISTAWKEDMEKGGFEELISNWRQPSSIHQGKNLLEEDLENILYARENVNKQNEELKRDLEFIRQEGDRIGKIVNGMRRLGNMNSNAKPHSINAIISDSIDIMSDLFFQKRFLIEKKLEANPDESIVDRDEIIQAMTNMMRNSLQAMDELGRVQSYPANTFTIKIKTYNDGEFICVDIEDNGVGIRSEHQNRLFENRFTTKSSDEGTGLGLNISRRFVRSYGGDIEFITSEPRCRTLFRIRFPKKQSELGKVPA